MTSTRKFRKFPSIFEKISHINLNLYNFWQQFTMALMRRCSFRASLNPNKLLLDMPPNTCMWKWLQTVALLYNRTSLNSRSRASCTTNKNATSGFWVVSQQQNCRLFQQPLHSSYTYSQMNKRAGAQLELLGNLLDLAGVAR